MEVKMKLKHSIYTVSLVFLLSFLIFTTACTKKSSTTPSSGAEFNAVYLVADAGNYSGARIDTNLVNAWGIAIGPTGKIWVSSGGKDRTTIYDGTGATVLSPIRIPFSGTRSSHGPTGAIFNNTTEFLVPGSTSSKFIYVNLDGTISAWTTGPTCIKVADRSATGASYTGAALGKVGTTNYLYAANFAGGKVDVFTSDFTYTASFSFADPTLPQGFSPYNIASIGGNIWVTYAPGSYNANGNGFVNIFSPDGTFIKRFASNGSLNFPWGMTKAPDGFGLGLNMYLVGNFGDGTISIFDQNGNPKGQLMAGSGPLTIDGLWALAPAPSTATSLDQNVVFFAAGPNFGAHGLVGYLKLIVATTTTTGGGY